jgi:hypothetical protein
MSAYCQSGRDSRHFDTAVMGHKATSSHVVSNSCVAKIKVLRGIKNGSVEPLPCS